jgi:hypothetical protein
MNATLNTMANPEFPFHNVSLLCDIIREKALNVSVACARAAKAHIECATERYVAAVRGGDIAYIGELVGVADMVRDNATCPKDRRFLAELVRVWDKRLLTGADRT